MQNISYIIDGGTPIYGKIRCMGAKNLVTKAMIASLLSIDTTRLRRVPNIGDVEITKTLLISTGVTIEWNKTINTMCINSSNITQYRIVPTNKETNRMPILLLSVLLHRFGKAIVPAVGGDCIGIRKIDYHIEAIKKFGGKVYIKGNEYFAHSSGGLKGCQIKIPYPSVGATETCLFLGVLAQGTSIITNIALEPEIIELITMLRSMGAIISINDTRELIIHGVSKLNGTNFFISGDRIEAASWACLACASNGKIEISGVKPNSLSNFLSYFNKIGGGFELLKNKSILFYRKSDLKAVEIETDIYPGFSTDLQQPLTIVLTQASGISIVHETVYENRFNYLHMLNKLGAITKLTHYCLGLIKCRYKNRDCLHSALIHGPTKLKSISEPLIIPDLRAGLAYLIAAVLADGKTHLSVARQIERGYGNLLDKLKDTNIKLKRIIS